MDLNFEAVAVNLLWRNGFRARLQTDARRFIEEWIQRRIFAGDIQFRAVGHNRLTATASKFKSMARMN